jgi:folate-dependent phosphoribosylglycinamide formyltransferase PurN
MRQYIYNPAVKGPCMTILCFVSGSGTNYREIVKRGPQHRYLVFTNRPGCGGAQIARQNGHQVVELSHVPYLREVRLRCGPGNVPRNCPEREAFEKEAVRLIEEAIGGQPDLICLAGYDQVNSDWFVDRYSPRILNVHPGDSSRGYSGLHAIPAIKALLAGEESLRSTLFMVDKGVDTGPILVQSRPLPVFETLALLDRTNGTVLLEKVKALKVFITARGSTTYPRWIAEAGPELKESMEAVGQALQEPLKVQGDWQIYPFGVHDLIAAGRVEVDGRRVYIDGREMPVYGYRLDRE